MPHLPRRRATLAAATSLIAAAGVLPALAAVPATAAAGDLFFSEYVEGSSNNKALEIYNGTGSPVDLAANGYAVKMYFNGSTTASTTVQLAGTVAAGDVFVLADDDADVAILAQTDQTITASVYNGDDAIALVKGTANVDVIGQIGVDPGTEWGSGLTSTADNTLRRKTAVTTGDTNGDDDFHPAQEWDGLAKDTFDGLGAYPGSPGGGDGGGGGEPPATQVCTLAPTQEIGAVQGSGDATPFAGLQVTVRGVVVGDEPGLGGFYLQDSDGDGSTATSDGIFVFSPVLVSLGDTVAVRGQAKENFGETEIVSNQDVAVCTPAPADPLSALPAPAPLDLPADDATRERLEGMLVTPVDALTVSEVFGLTRFGELRLSEGGLLVQPTELARPGSPEAVAIAAGNEMRQIVLDDGSSASRSVTNRPYLSADTPVRVGDTLTFASPLVLGYGFSLWRLQPADGTPEGTFEPQNTRTPAPEDVGGDVKIASFNVLNYFLTLAKDGGRGATTAAQHEKQADKIVPAIEALGADVVTLMEIEDTASTGYGDGTPDQAVAELVARLNVAAGNDTWAYSPLPRELLAVDRDVIRSAIIYRKDRVQPVGAPVGLVDEDVWFNAREPIAQTFVKDGDVFTVVANHFKSKSPGSAEGDNVDKGDGAGQWNGDRVRQARSLAAFTDRLRESTGDDDVLLMGDFNAYTKEDPIEELRAAGFVDLGSTFDAGRYSYVFDNLSGSLDHALGTASVTAKVTDVVHWNINSVESFAYQYTGDPNLYAPIPYRASDHDPLVVGLDLDERCSGLLPTIVGTAGDDVITGTNHRDVIMGLGGNDVITGGNGDDVICGGGGEDVVLGGNGGDTLLGGFGADRLEGGNGPDTLVGGPGVDLLDGGNGPSSLTQEGAES